VLRGRGTSARCGARYFAVLGHQDSFLVGLADDEFLQVVEDNEVAQYRGAMAPKLRRR